MRWVLYLGVIASAVMADGEIERVERISKEIETLRQDYETCQALLQSVPVQKETASYSADSIRVLNEQEQIEREVKRLNDEVKQCSQKSLQLEKALADAAAELARIKKTTDEQIAALTEDAKRSAAAARSSHIQALKEEEKLSAALVAAETTIVKLRKRIALLETKKVEPSQKVKNVETVKYVAKQCEEPNPFPKLMKKASE